MEKERDRYLKKAKKVQEYNIFYDLTEVIVALTAGFSSGSSALIGWGLDSVVEVISAGTLWWRLKGELHDIPEARVIKRQKITLFVIASSFLLISIFITWDSVSKFLNRETPAWSTAGLVILLASLLANPVLIW